MGAKIEIAKENCIATTHPQIAAQWHPTLNGELTPFDVREGSTDRVWWLLRLIRISALRVYVMVIVRNLLRMEISVRDFLKDKNATLAAVISQHRNTWRLINSIW